MSLLSNFYWRYPVQVLSALPSFVSAGIFSEQGDQTDNIPRAILTLPPNLTPGNLLVAFINLRASTSPLNPPIVTGGVNTGIGWSLIEAVNNTIYGGVGLVLFKYVTANEPAGYVFSLDAIKAGTNRGAGQILQFKDAYWYPSFSGAFFGSGSTVSASALQAPSSSLELFFGFDGSGSTPLSTPSGMTQIASNLITTVDNGESLVVCTLENTAAATLAAPSATTTDNLGNYGGQAHNLIISSQPTYNREAAIALSIYASTAQSSAFNVPQGALICVTVLFRTQSGDPVVTDSAGNTYASTTHYTDANGTLDSQSFFVLSSAAYTGNVVTITGVSNIGYTATVMCYSKPSGSWSVESAYAVTTNYQNYNVGSWTTSAASLILGGGAEAYSGTDVSIYTYPVLSVAHDFNSNSSGVSCLEYYSAQAATYTVFAFDAFVGKGYGGVTGLNLISFI